MAINNDKFSFIFDLRTRRPPYMNWCAPHKSRYMFSIEIGGEFGRGITYEKSLTIRGMLKFLQSCQYSEKADWNFDLSAGVEESHNFDHNVNHFFRSWNSFTIMFHFYWKDEFAFAKCNSSWLRPTKRFFLIQIYEIIREIRLSLFIRRAIRGGWQKGQSNFHQCYQWSLFTVEIVCYWSWLPSRLHSSPIVAMPNDLTTQNSIDRHIAISDKQNWILNVGMSFRFKCHEHYSRPLPLSDSLTWHECVLVSFDFFWWFPCLLIESFFHLFWESQYIGLRCVRFSPNQITTISGISIIIQNKIVIEYSVPYLWMIYGKFIICVFG